MCTNYRGNYPDHLHFQLLGMHFRCVQIVSVKIILPDIVLRNLFSIDLISYVDKLSKTYESPFRLWLGPLMVVFIADAENIEIIMKSKDCLNKPFTFYKMIRDAISADGLFTLKGTVLTTCNTN